MSVILKCSIKDRGSITWPPIGEPDGTPERTREQKRDWLREQITVAAEDTRAALGTTPTRTVLVSVTFKPDIMVDA